MRPSVLKNRLRVVGGLAMMCVPIGMRKIKLINGAMLGV